jgi:hypothetical protein
MQNQTKTKDIVKINNHDLQVLEFKKERIISFDDIDQLHDRPSGTARRNFNANKHRFSHNKHYFCFKKRGFNEIRTDTPENVTSEDFPLEKAHTVNPEIWSGMGFSEKSYTATMITKRGYLLLVKSFNDDIAWDVQEKLVDRYFEPHEQKPTGTITGYKAIYDNAIQLGNPDIAHAAHVEMMKAMDREVKKPKRKGAKHYQTKLTDNDPTPAAHFLEIAREMILTGYIEKPEDYIGRSLQSRKIAIWFAGLHNHYERYCQDKNIKTMVIGDIRLSLKKDAKGTPKPFRVNTTTRRSYIFDDDRAPKPVRDALEFILAATQSTRG